MMVRTKIFVKEDTKMLYTEKEKHEIERVKEVFAEHLRESKGNQKVVGGVRVADKEEQRRFFVPQLIKLQFVIRHDLPKLGNIKGSQSCTAGNQDAFGCLARDKLSRTFSSNSQKIHKRGVRSTVWLLTPRLIDYIFPFSRSLQRYA